MSVEEINQGLNYITYGLYIVTTVDGEKKNGLIVNTVFQVTAEPARMAISVNKQSLTHEMILKSRVFAAMPLEESTPLPFIGTFGFRTGRTFDKFAKVPYKTGFLGCPVVTEHTLSYMEVEVQQMVDVGTHTLFIGEVKDAGVLKPNGQALTYAYYHNVIKGKTPKGATHA
ncbi:MAG: flavin reductase family protein [Elusimicrobia bacterium]|nr:flavin reductase [Elusimicrobiaceae bacterium]MBP3513182.1 flavin reductase [Elusimicrobiaceae bacterium]MDD7578888.1 flavin reductase family protein [Elusimicrobiota bacterium]MDY6039584.1 flavin reductase family protein [Elusimicrobiaceae bacterium]